MNFVVIAVLFGVTGSASFAQETVCPAGLKKDPQGQCVSTVVQKTQELSFDGTTLRGDIVRPEGKWISVPGTPTFECDFRKMGLAAWKKCMGESIALAPVPDIVQTLSDEISSTLECPKSKVDIDKLRDLSKKSLPPGRMRTRDFLPLIERANNLEDPGFEFHLPVGCGYRADLRAWFRFNLHCKDADHCFSGGVSDARAGSADSIYAQNLAPKDYYVMRRTAPDSKVFSINDEAKDLKYREKADTVVIRSFQKYSIYSNQARSESIELTPLGNEVYLARGVTEAKRGSDTRFVGIVLSLNAGTFLKRACLLSGEIDQERATLDPINLRRANAEVLLLQQKADDFTRVKEIDRIWSQSFTNQVLVKALAKERETRVSRLRMTSGEQWFRSLGKTMPTLLVGRDPCERYGSFLLDRLAQTPLLDDEKSKQPAVEVSPAAESAVPAAPVAPESESAVRSGE